MKKILFALLTIGSLSACSYTQMPVVHSIPLSQADFSKSLQIREGESCGYAIFGFIGPFGDIKLTKAIKYGHVNKVVGVDRNFKNFILFTKDCIRVYGY